MKLELSKQELFGLVSKQLDSLFEFDKQRDGALLEKGIDAALERLEYCFSHIANKYYNRDGQSYFNPFHSGQYMSFLYFLSRSVYELEPGTSTLQDRVFYLNKTLNGLDVFYEVKLPSIFYSDHPLGAVLGRATYGDRFTFMQGISIGNNRGYYPVIGNNVTVFTGCTVVGNCNIGDNVMISAGAFVKDTDIPPCSIVYGESPNLVIKSRPAEDLQTINFVPQEDVCKP